MWRVINTRPVERAAPLTSALQQAGFAVLELPLLALNPCPFDAGLQQQLRRIIAAQCVVVVSPKAAQLGVDYLRQLGISAQDLNLQWIAVGQGTAKQLSQSGIQALTPEIETSEGMMSLDIFAHLPASPIQADTAKTMMLWRGFGGRQFMLEQLTAQGWQIVDVKLYQRKLPLQSISEYNLMLERCAEVLLISSGQSWQNWLQLAAQHNSSPIYPKFILVLGARVYQQIVSTLAISSAVQQTQVVQMDDLQPSSIVSMLKRLQKCEQT
jgi:uroporphyrinogen-III synthase